MLSKSRALITSALLLSSVVVATPAAAAIPVIDPTAIARIREVVTTAGQQLATAKQSLGQLTQMKNTIGQVGQGQIGSIMQQSGLDFGGATGVLQDVRTLSQSASSIGQAAQGLKIPGEANLSIPSVIDNVEQGRDAAGKLFFFNGNSAMTQEQVGSLRTRRQTVLRETAVTSYGAATALRSNLEESRQIAEKLAAQAKAAPDLRTDVQVSTAALLAMYAELQKQTSMTAQMLELESARVLAGDATGRRASN